VLTTSFSKIDHSWLKGRLKYVYISPDNSTGEAIGYYENGAMWFRYMMVNEELHGLGRTYYENGQIEIEEHYSHGLLEGTRRTWYPTGELCMESSYLQGMLHGSRKEWYRNGKLKRSEFYLNDRASGNWTEWYEDGTIKQEATYRDGLRHGILKQRSHDGKSRSKKIYIRGVLITTKVSNLINDGELSAERILSIRNTAIRRVCLEEFGYARFLAQVPHQILDKDGDQELIKISWHNREDPIFLVKVKCPSTGVFYTLRVPPTMQRVHQAIAWTFGTGEKEYAPVQET
jgi:antitoxin component YwqK of YwqJK toxin-antitoxin module